MSSDFVNVSLLQLQAAAQLPCGGISETATNAALALIEAAAPRNEIEGALAVQIADDGVAFATRCQVLTAVRFYKLGSAKGLPRRSKNFVFARRNRAPFLIWKFLA
jgi:hypothetical protein